MDFPFPFAGVPYELFHSCLLSERDMSWWHKNKTFLCFLCYCRFPGQPFTFPVKGNFDQAVLLYFCKIYMQEIDFRMPCLQMQLFNSNDLSVLQW